jgi:hypothetical protein
LDKIDKEEIVPTIKLPDTAEELLRDLIAEYPKEDFPTLRKVIGLGKVRYEDRDILPGMPVTAAVLNTKPYTLLFGKKFLETNANCIEDCVYILSHELTHLVLDHFAKDILDEFKNFDTQEELKKQSKVENIDTDNVKEDTESPKKKKKGLRDKAVHIIVDCQVNATVVNSLTDPKYHEFIKRYYSKDQMPYCFFRPDGEPPTDELKELHKKLYSIDGITNYDLIKGLLPWFKEQQDNLDSMVKNLLGNHKDLLNDKGNANSQSDELSDLTEAIASDLSDYFNRDKEEQEGPSSKSEGGEESTPKEDDKPNGKNAGKGDTIRQRQVSSVLDSLNYVKNIKSRLKRKDVISPRSRIFRAISNYVPKKCIRSVVPNFHDRRTVSLYTKGKTPIFHKRPQFGSKTIVPCYLDVSGSQDHVLGETTKAVSQLRQEIGNVVYCFSTIIHETNIGDLRVGKFNSTGGTDFNPLGNHLLKNNFTCAVILTDGEAHINSDLVEQIKRRGIDITIGWTTPNPRRHPLEEIAKKTFFVFGEKEIE